MSSTPSGTGARTGAVRRGGAELTGFAIQLPWHGSRFEVRTGQSWPLRLGPSETPAVEA
ncbi:MAG: hypothetical protein ABSF83_04070 [Nitrososphaerales archaeon]